MSRKHRAPAFPPARTAFLIATLIAVAAASSGCGRPNPAVLTIRGTVTDMAGAPLYGAEILLRYEESALRYLGPAVQFARRDQKTTYTDSTGTYAFEFRPGFKIANCSTLGLEVRAPLYQMAIQKPGEILCTEAVQVFDFELAGG